MNVVVDMTVTIQTKKALELQRQNLMRWIETARYFIERHAQVLRRHFLLAIKQQKLEEAQAILHQAEQNKLLPYMLAPLLKRSEVQQADKQKDNLVKILLACVPTPILSLTSHLQEVREKVAKEETSAAFTLTPVPTLRPEPTPGWAQYFGAMLPAWLYNLYNATSTSQFTALLSAGMWGVNAAARRLAYGQALLNPALSQAL